MSNMLKVNRKIKTGMTVKNRIRLSIGVRKKENLLNGKKSPCCAKMKYGVHFILTACILLNFNNGLTE